MKVIWQLFVNDMKRIFGNLVTGLIILGLVLLPSIFSWYNVLACWDVFHNTGNLKVAVVNNDEGYQSDLVPLKVNMGEQVSTSLLANNQMDWILTDEDDAMDGAKSGKYYAAVVIPESFSKDMMTFYSDESSHADLIYYSNDKKNVVAPKLTDQGASKASDMVNQVFTKTITEVGLNVASSLLKYSDNANLDSRLGDLADHVNSMGAQMSDASKTLKTYASVLDASQSLVTGSAQLLGQAGDSASQVMDSANQAKDSVSSMSDALKASNDVLGQAISNSASGYDGLSSSIDAAFASSGDLAGSSATNLRSQADSVKSKADQFESLASQIDDLAAQQTDPDLQKTLEGLAKQMHVSADSQEALAKGLADAASGIESGNADAQSKHQEVSGLIDEAKQSVGELSDDYNSTIKPQLDTLMGQISSMSSSLSSSASTLDSVSDDLQNGADSLSGRIATAKQKLLDTASDLDSSAEKFTSLSAAMYEALSSGDIEQLKTVLYSDPDALASALAAPVQLERHAVFPAENFGSQMAPLYTTLGLWVGSLLLAVAIKVNVSRKAQLELGYPKLHQLFLGRFGVFAFVSLCQTTILALGNMLFLQVQVEEPLLYLICFWLAGLVFTFIIYTLVVSFANLGKAIAVFLLIIQVTSGGGSYPLQTLPDFFQWLSPFLPATHVISAMRAAMMGVYCNDFWIEIGQLLLFVVPFLLLGLVFRKPLMKFLNWYVEKVEESKLVC
jgi:putative membrane protein